MSKEKKQSSGALLVAAGIFLSRIAGLVRERVFAHFFGQSDAGDAFKAALKIPNFLQNLFGEGVLSASFIPVYAQLLSQGKEQEAKKLAWATLSLLFLLTSFFVALGVLWTPFFIDLIAPGFVGEKRELTILLVRILFPGTGVLVLSAWCLGVLNSHHKFFLSYVAPVLWNLAFIVIMLLGAPGLPLEGAAEVAACSLLFGSFLQFAVQLPSSLKLIRSLKAGEAKSGNEASAGDSIRQVVKSFVPVVVSRGVVQISAYIDNIIASFLPMGAVSALAYAQTLYLLPISLFGMSVSAAELPAFSKEMSHQDDYREKIQGRLRQGLSHIAFFVIPSWIAFLLIGPSLIALLFQTGKFDAEATEFVAWVLAASSVGLLANTQGRLYSSVFYALKLPQIPLKAAVLRVLVSSSLGALAALKGPQWLGLSESMGVVLLALVTGLVGWLEYLFLSRTLQRSLGIRVELWREQGPLLGVALVGGLFAGGLQYFLPWNMFFKSIFVIAVYGLIYLGGALLLGHPLVQRILAKFLKS